MVSFYDELEKRSVVGTVGRIGRLMAEVPGSLGAGLSKTVRLVDPRQTRGILREGWHHMTPAGSELQNTLKSVKRLGMSWEDYARARGLSLDPATAVHTRGLRQVREAQSALPEAQRLAAEHGRWGGRAGWLGGTGARGAAKRLEGQASKGHLYEESIPLMRAARDPKVLAEELSRRGWTGQGPTGKYIPWGGKGIVTGLGAGFTIPAVAKKDPHGDEKGRFERIGEHIGGNLGLVAAMPTGFAGFMGGWELGAKALGLPGKGVDKLIERGKLRKQLQNPQPAAPPYTELPLFDQKGYRGGPQPERQVVVRPRGEA
jgi:hypothetical protein